MDSIKYIPGELSAVRVRAQKSCVRVAEAAGAQALTVANLEAGYVVGAAVVARLLVVYERLRHCTHGRGVCQCVDPARKPAK